MRVQVGCMKLWVEGKLCIWFEVKFRISQGGEEKKGRKSKKNRRRKKGGREFLVKKAGGGEEEGGGRKKDRKCGTKGMKIGNEEG